MEIQYESEKEYKNLVMEVHQTEKRYQKALVIFQCFTFKVWVCFQDSAEGFAFK